MRSVITALLVLLMLPVVGLAADKTIEVDFEFTPPADKTVESYLLYRNGTLACTIPVEADYTFECTLSDTPSGAMYTLAAHYTDATDSESSPPYWFSWVAPRRIKINGLKVNILLTPP